MRLLHTSDWHIGKTIASFSRYEEQAAVLDEISGIIAEKDVDVVLIAGDLFDQYNPSNQSLELFYQKVKKMTGNGRRVVIAIAGNHDSPDKIEVPDPLARQCGIIFAGYPNTMIKPFTLENGLSVTQSQAGFIELKLPQYSYPLRIIFTPYANEYRLKKFLQINHEMSELKTILKEKWQGLAAQYCDQQGVNIFMAHLLFLNQQGDILPEPDDEKSIMIGGASAIEQQLIPRSIQYAALGHLHRHQIISQKPVPVVYSGSLLEYSLSETRQDKAVYLIQVEPGEKADYQALSLNQGRKVVRQKFDSLQEARKWLLDHQDVYVEITLKTDHFIKAEEKNSLYEIHDRILALIPEVSGAEDLNQSVQIDLNKNIEQLFTDYFHYQTGQKPDQQILDIFREIVHLEEEQ